MGRVETGGGDDSEMRGQREMGDGAGGDGGWRRQ